MKVLLVNTYDNGGAANACIRLHLALVDNGIDSHLLASRNLKNIRNTSVLDQRIKKLSFLEKLYFLILKILLNFKIISGKVNEKEQFLEKRKEENLEIFTFPGSNYDITSSPFYKDADIINLHWVARFLDFESFFKKNEKPVVWTLHDMNPFLGGQHYMENYSGIDATGNILERHINKKEQEYSNSILNLKKMALADVKNLTIVAPSKWLLGEANKSLLFSDFPSICIPYGLDSATFSPRNKEFSQDVLGLNPTKKNILFVADTLNNQRKGIHVLLKAIELIGDSNIRVHAIGRNFELLNLRNSVNYLGEINNDNFMSIAYSAVDVFVIPSLMDNLPNTVLESLMCGTPVIGFDIGGIPDMISDGNNGILVKDISANGLKVAINRFFSQGIKWTNNEIRSNAKEHYRSSLQAERYISLFKQILFKD